MIYLDFGATSFVKPPEVKRAVSRAMDTCASPGRGGYPAAMAASRLVYGARETAAKLFDCQPEQAVFTSSCTHGLNIAISSLISPGDRVVISGFEHNAVVRPLYALGAEIVVAGRRLFDWEDTISSFRRALDRGAKAAVFTHVSNVFGYELPVQELAAVCREKGVPFILDAAQSAGKYPISLNKLGAAFIAAPGHKGLLGPQGTGLLLCGAEGTPLLYGGTGSQSASRRMPPELPERLEAGTLNVPGIAGLGAGMAYVLQAGPENIGRRERGLILSCADALCAAGAKVYRGPHQGGTLSFTGNMDCEELADALSRRGFALRAGLHCAPLAHESAGTAGAGTVRLSVGYGTTRRQLDAFCRESSKILLRRK